MSHISTSQFMQDPVDAVQITPENIDRLALWVHGEVKVDRTTGRSYIEMEVSHPTGRRTAKAYPKDWIVTVRTVRRVYGNRAFTSTFKPVPERSELLRQIEMYIMATVMDAIQVTISKGTSEDEKTTQLSEIIEKSSSRILGLL